MLKGQDIVILVLLRLRPRQEWTYEAISKSIRISSSQCYAAIQRLQQARLLIFSSENVLWRVPSDNFKEYVIHGLKYHFPAQIGSLVRGIPTAHSAEFVSKNFIANGVQEGDYVWPSPDGFLKGNSLQPLHPSQLHFAPKAKSFFPNLDNNDIYETFVCIDLLRVGSSREQKWAAEKLEQWNYGS